MAVTIETIQLHSSGQVCLQFEELRGKVKKSTELYEKQTMGAYLVGDEANLGQACLEFEELRGKNEAAFLSPAVEGKGALPADGWQGGRSAVAPSASSVRHRPR